MHCFNFWKTELNKEKILLNLMSILAALNLRRNLLLFACYVVCSASDWAHHNMTVNVLLLYVINEMLKTLFIGRLNTV
jgi:hypothetical protein